MTARDQVEIAADRDALARELYATDIGALASPEYADERRKWWDLLAPDVVDEVKRSWLRRADALLSSGVLVDAADVRARALEDAADAMPLLSFGSATNPATWLRDRAVSERDRETR